MTEIDPTENRGRSVTANEQRYAAFNFYLLPFAAVRPLTNLPPDPPTYWSYSRDIVLRETIRAESRWGSALGIAITKMQNAGYSIEGSKRKVAWAHDLLANVDFHKGWKYFIQRSGRDYLTTDNGAFVEVIRASKGPGSKIVALAHLDSLRCRRTGDDEIPVVYRDLVGAEHELHWHQVFSVVDMPDPSETLRGVGYCAASRAYHEVYKMASIERYIAEKASGRRPTKLTFISNIGDKQITSAMQAAQEEANRKGYTTYMGAAVIPTMSQEVPAVVEVKLMEIDERVDLEKERSGASLIYADAIGLDVQEIQPLTHGSSNTATQSVVLDEKERGKFGWFEAFGEQLNLHKIVGGAVTFAFSHKDWRDQQLESGVRLSRAQARQIQVTIGEITPEESRQIAAQFDDVPQEFLDREVLDQQTLYDDDNPDQVQEAEDDTQMAGVDRGAASAPETGAPLAGAAPTTQPRPAAGTTPKEGPAQHVISRALRTKEAVSLKQHDGAMVAFFMPAPLSYQLALNTAVKVDPSLITLPSEMHVTLVYLGKVADIANYRIPLQEALDTFARNEQPLMGAVNGVARFATPEDGNTNALVALFDSPDLPAFRQRLLGAVMSTGIPLQANHGFIPHVTLAYLPFNAPTPTLSLPTGPLNLGRIVLAWGGEQTEFELAAPVTTKARGAVDLATITPGRVGDLYYNDVPEDELMAYLDKVADEFDEYGAILTQAAFDECPKVTGALANSIGYAVEGKGTRDISLRAYAGNSARPEVVVRANLYGRRGFGPKNPKGVLAFEGKDGDMVFVKHVGPAEANDWFGRAWDRTEPQRRSMIGRIGRLGKELIAKRDVKPVNAPHIDGFKKGKELWAEPEPVVIGSNGHNLWEDA